ncbi:hypothetical protein JTB14_015663 [Gonioctena quinquepunctata]|nr:hypothetical protein JTB14_015663 [Gonioctena quinquepunctata]
MMSSGKVAVGHRQQQRHRLRYRQRPLRKFDGVVYLTSRDIARGKEAVERLKQLGLEPLYPQTGRNRSVQLDTFKKFIETSHGGLDLLVNNAGVRLKGMEPFGKQAEETLRVNYFGVVNLCEAMFPLLRNNARMVNISSSSGHLSKIPTEEVRSRFRRPDLTVADVNKLMEEFIRLAHERQVLVEGWGKQTYLVSKVGLTALTFIQQRLFDGETPYRNISVNAVHPGYVSTDLVDHKGPLTVEEGARVPLLVALESDCKGKYVWCDGREVDWYADVTPALS